MKASEMSNEQLATELLSDTWIECAGDLTTEAATRLRTMIPVPQVQVRITNAEGYWPYTLFVDSVAIGSYELYEAAFAAKQNLEWALRPTTKEAQ